MTSLPENLGAALRDLRQRKGVGIRELARRAGASKRSIQDWETGRHVPSGAALGRILSELKAPERVRSRLLAQAAPGYARLALADTALGAPVDVGQVLRAMRLRRGTTQARLARVVGTSQATLARWESGDSTPSTEALQRALYALGASPEEAVALLSVKWRAAFEGDPDDAERRLRLATDAPIALRDVLLLGLESELWWRAAHDPSMETALGRITATRAHQCVLRGAIDEIDGHVRRTLRLVRATGQTTFAAPAIFAGCWKRQRIAGGATGAANSLGRWSERMDHEQTRQWLSSAQGFAMIRAGETAFGVERLEKLEREAHQRDDASRAFFQTNLVEAYLLAKQPGRAVEVLTSIEGGAGPLPVVKTLLALGEEPSPRAMQAARTFGETSWGARQEVTQIEAELDLVRRGRKARFY